MGIKNHLSCGLALLAALAAAPQAEAFSIHPINLILTEEEPITVLRIGNDEAEARTVELQAFDWQQSDGEDRLTPSQHLIVTPPIFELAPGEERLVRVGLVDNSLFDGRERAFRLLMQDITPATESPGGNALQVRLQFLLPVFIPTRLIEPNVTFTATRNADGNLCLLADNQGDSSIKLLWVAPEEAQEDRAGAQKYVFPGQRGLACTPGAYATFAGRALTIGFVTMGETTVETHRVQVDDSPPSAIQQ